MKSGVNYIVSSQRYVVGLLKMMKKKSIIFMLTPNTNSVKSHIIEWILVQRTNSASLVMDGKQLGMPTDTG